ncbi:MAG: hypothetical protein JXN64_14630 [Spirochaetes bacterium]|nr:hypothetical protein [Spirochaetota bacterium]
MNKETIGQKEINVSHDLSGRINARKERLEPREGLYKKSMIMQHLKTA